MKYTRVIIACILTVGYLAGCKSKDEKKESFFPVLSFIKSQVAHIDTSLYRIIKQVSVDSTWDSSFIKREEFRGYAADFLELPDLSDKSNSAGYEESKFFDASVNRVTFTYSPRDKSQPIQREDVTVEPGAGEPDKVKSFFIDKLVANSDSVTVTKRMLWVVDKSFQITTITQKSGKPDSTQTIKISWE